MLSWFPIFFPLAEPMYLPAHSELDVQMWRLTDNTKRRVWFEWAAQAYLPVSTLGGLSARGGGPGGAGARNSLTSPPTSATSGSFSLGGALSPTLAGSDAAFASAPSPHLGASMSGGGGGGGEGRMPGIAEENAGGLLDGSVLGSGVGDRIKISQTRLHNPGGKTSWIGL